VGGDREGKEETAARKKGIGFGGEAALLIKAGERAAVNRGRRSGSSVSVRRQRGRDGKRRRTTASDRPKRYGPGWAGPGGEGEEDSGQEEEVAQMCPAPVFFCTRILLFTDFAKLIQTKIFTKFKSGIFVVLVS
jgi:hypothetical protein